MAITTRDFDTMTQAVLDRILAANVGITDTSKGSVIRTIIESIISEIDIQYYQIDNVYNSYNVDLTTGDDLDNVIAILGVTRDPAVGAIGTARFSRSTPALTDIVISAGTVISTQRDTNGVTIEFATTEEGTIVTGDTYVDIEIQAVVGGEIYVGANKLVVMNTPIIGVESVTNSSEIDGGTDEESDASLRDKAKRKLAALGKGTINALDSALREVDGIVDVSVLDKNRGLGTVDIIVVATDMPPTQTILDDVNAVIADVKPAGVDVDVIYPSIITVDVTVTITGSNELDNDSIGNTIIEYFQTMTLGEKFIIKQMERRILSIINDDNVDITTELPISNVTIGENELVRYGTITINDVEWTPS